MDIRSFCAASCGKALRTVLDLVLQVDPMDELMSSEIYGKKEKTRTGHSRGRRERKRYAPELGQ